MDRALFIRAFSQTKRTSSNSRICRRGIESRHMHNSDTLEPMPDMDHLRILWGIEPHCGPWVGPSATVGHLHLQEIRFAHKYLDNKQDQGGDICVHFLRFVLYGRCFWPSRARATISITVMLTAQALLMMASISYSNPRKTAEGIFCALDTSRLLCEHYSTMDR